VDGNDDEDEVIELSPDRQKLLEELKDARTLENAIDEDEDAKEEGKGDGEENPRKRRREPRPKKTVEEIKAEREKEYEEEKIRRKDQFEKLATKDYDPYAGLDLTKGDGKIQVEEEDDEKGPGEMHDVKYRFFIMKRPKLPQEFDKYFKRFDWK